MRMLTTEDLWPVLDRVAASQPEGADDFIEAVLRELCLPRYSRHLCSLLVHRNRHPPVGTLLSRLGTFETTRRFDLHAFMLLAYVAGASDARRGSWTDVVRQASSNYELTVIEVSHALEKNGRMSTTKAFNWRSRPPRS
jgi:hypothetical protein